MEIMDDELVIEELGSELFGEEVHGTILILMCLRVMRNPVRLIYP